MTFYQQAARLPSELAVSPVRLLLYEMVVERRPDGPLAVRC